MAAGWSPRSRFRTVGERAAKTGLFPFSLSGRDSRFDRVSDSPDPRRLEAEIADLEKRLDALISAFESLLRSPTQEAPIRRELAKAKQKTWNSRVW